MKAKLYKVLDQYHLYDGDKAMATTIVGNPMLLPNLSKQNCDEIFGVVDVEKLAREWHKQQNFNSLSDNIISVGYLNMFKDGFNKAMELNKDKVFTLEDMLKAYEKGASFGTTKLGNTHYFDKLTQSLQQPKIEVEIEMVCPHPMDTYRCGLEYSCDEDGCNHPNQIPYLDSNGCLMLKKI